MDEKDWYMLKALHDEGSITKASEVLYVSQPALTKRIKQLESDFRMEFISRSSKGIRFTKEGEYLVNYAKDMITALQKTKDALNNMSSNSVSGTLRLGGSFNFAHNHLPYLLKEFSQQFPLVKTDIRTGYSSDIIKQLQDEIIQIGIVRGEFSWNGPKKHLKSENICLVSNKEIDVSDLPNLPRVVYKTDPLLKKQLDQWWYDVYKQPPTIAMEVDNSKTCVGMVSQGLGFAILPQYSLDINSNLYLKNLQDADGNQLHRDTWIIYKEKDIKFSTVNEFVKFIEQRMEEK
ncbi:LysR family transcriptional regulator [Oceanobacillus saliphilus]|uniref:LysR family transcriptional regulator n=1 Tax=Oceanobacillus saliphilus TaxID=2925834 RepID=UPI00201D40AD|nr:LysR family transcriptional regulator [Oceanobacillus saliphilus]